MGEEPRYSLSVEPSGRVVFEGNRGVVHIGTLEQFISQDSFAELVREFVCVDFEGLQERYGLGANDLTTYVITLESEGRSKTVELYWPPGTIAQWGGPVTKEERELWPLAHDLHRLIRILLEETSCVSAAKFHWGD